MRDLSRLLRPQSIAVVGGGTWCENVIRACRAFGFDGPIWPVHPSRPAVAGERAFSKVTDLPGTPDAAFVGVNRRATVDVVGALAKRGAGGAICFASGFLEAIEEMSDGADLQTALRDAAGKMPIVGPNCYGLINGLDRVTLWPDQHGIVPVDRGVAIITQSSNIALNLTMQRRGLPIAYLMTAGNQAQVDLADLGMAALADDRVTVLGLHIEGIGDLRRFEALTEAARAAGKSIVALKIGASAQAQVATVSHTASLAGSAAGADALLARLGILQVRSLSVMLETLKLLHVTGPLSSNRIASMSCSGGEASLMADTALGRKVMFPPLNDAQTDNLRAALGPKVALANPLDYHTYIWSDLQAMTACFAAMMDPSLALGCVVLDFPRDDRCDASEWSLVITAIRDAMAKTGVPMAVLSSLPDTLPEEVAQSLIKDGIVPLCGVDDGLEAIALAASPAPVCIAPPILLPGPAAKEGSIVDLTEARAKTALQAGGVDIPRFTRAASTHDAGALAADLGFPVALKGEGFAHKAEVGAVALDLRTSEAVVASAALMPCTHFLVEEMIQDGIVDLLIGAVNDPAHGFVLSLGAGGTFTELLNDTTHLILPVDGLAIETALDRLSLAPRLHGYRGAPTVNRGAIVKAVLAVQEYVTTHAAQVLEVEINPLICTPDRAVAVDALIRLRQNK